MAEFSKSGRIQSISFHLLQEQQWRCRMVAFKLNQNMNILTFRL